jgi:hypothetical protein
MKVLEVLMFTGALVMLVPLFRLSLPPAYLPALVLLVGLNPWFWDFKDQILSDIPFLCFVLLSLGVFLLTDAKPPDRHRVRRSLLIGAAAYMAYATRTAGIALLPAFLAHDLFRHRTVRSTTLLACVTCAALAGAQYFLWVRDASYADQLTVTAAGFARNMTEYARSFSEFWDNGYSDLARKGVFLASIALAALGYWKASSHNVGVVEVYPWIYGGIVLLWPSFQGARFLIPLAPLAFYYALCGVRQLERLMARAALPKNLALGAFLALTFLSYAARYTTLPFGPFVDGVEKPESVALFAFVKTATGPDDVPVFSRPRALALFTGRRVAAPYSPADPCSLWRYLEEIRATYVVTGPDNTSADAEYLARFVARFSGNFQVVMSNRDLAVYRIDRRSCTA